MILCRISLPGVEISGVIRGTSCVAPLLAHARRNVPLMAREEPEPYSSGSSHADERRWRVPQGRAVV